MLLAVPVFLAACGGSSEPAATDCGPVDQAALTAINDTLAPYEQGETASGGTSVPVDLPGAGSMNWDLLVAAKLTKAGEPGLWALNQSAGFIVPLNQAAISAMPDAAVTDQSAISDAVNSAEGQAALACVK